MYEYVHIYVYRDDTHTHTHTHTHVYMRPKRGHCARLRLPPPMDTRRVHAVTRLERITPAITRLERMPLHALALQALRVFRLVKLTKRLTGL